MEKILKCFGIIFSLCILSSFIYSNDISERALIIEGDSKSVSGAFSIFKKNNPNVQFDVFQFAHNEEDGSGNAITIDFYGLYEYDYILISVHEGSLSPHFIERIAAYVLEGGRAYIMYQSYPRPYYVDAMAENSNQLLKYFRIDDEIIYDSLKIENRMFGSLIEVDDKTRKINTSRKAVARLKHTPNTTSSTYTCQMESGHFFYKNSDLSEASKILEFNADSLRAPIAAFWTAGNGVIGIGTEKHSSCSTTSHRGYGWKLIWDGLNIPVNYQPEKEVVEVQSNPEAEYLTRERLTQIRDLDERYLKKLQADMKTEKKRLEADFKRYVAAEKEKLKTYRFRNKIEQQKLKRELENLVYELKKDEYKDYDSSYGKNEIAYLDEKETKQTDNHFTPTKVKESNSNPITTPNTQAQAAVNRPASSVQNMETSVSNSGEETKPIQRSATYRTVQRPKSKTEETVSSQASIEVVVSNQKSEERPISNNIDYQKPTQKRSYKKNVAAVAYGKSSVKTSQNKAKVVLNESELNNNQILVEDPNNVFESGNRKKIDSQLSDIKSAGKSNIVVIESHLDYFDKPMDNFLKSIRSGHKIKQYYTRNGIDPDQIILYGMGSAYAMGSQMIVSQRESDYVFEGNIKKINTPNQTSTAYDLYEKKSQGITFRISLGTKPIAWNPKLIDKLGDFTVEQYGNERIMTGVVGIFKDPYFVQEIIDIIQDWKMPNPELLVYLDGIRLKSNEITQLSSKYSELGDYLNIISRS